MKKFNRQLNFVRNVLEADKKSKRKSSDDGLFDIEYEFYQ